ncbi:MAG: phosphoadenylyLSUlfate reductase (thioredoxin) [Candidatus Uhrbacteria bacterium GW2011_GWF2_41_16]|uniref:Adenosine 5'-phosphosulfate reductase n=1 Tax=Candidatus Uhrbacteria bacterium GW2011_GWF2_41_16 TaxID=1618997 RepID=A0A0G0V6T8_9BACT|nr:MAG: phosphoadenylyLSUlfate reductase (thioredoxin) [Candidatus Uhrbacteria bacterium GW2011_GWF2_41_16]
MNKDDINNINDKLKYSSPQEVLSWAVSEIGCDNIAFATSLGAEDQVLTHILRSMKADVSIFTIDTGCLYAESHDLIQETESLYDFKYEILTPESYAVEEMINTHGKDLFYKSLELRKLCCRLRKIEPLKNKLSSLDAWICGLRRDQSITRTNIEKVQWDEVFGIIKVNPLVDWDEKKVWDYVKKYKVPYHKLHDRGYPSIGCEPCTRAIKPGEDVRAGRWWWENKEQKECGLHQKMDTSS